MPSDKRRKEKKQDKEKQPALTILAKYARGERQEMKHWSAFIENDPESKKKAGLLGHLHNMIDRLDLPQTAPAAVSMAADIFDSHRHSKIGGEENRARLYYDSRLIPLPEGVRPSLVSERRLKYQTGFGELELSIIPVYPGRFEITGRFGNDEVIQPDMVVLRGRKTSRTEIDRFGFFSFAVVNPGTYSLQFNKEGDKQNKKTIVENLKLQ